MPNCNYLLYKFLGAIKPRRVPFSNPCVLQSSRKSCYVSRYNHRTSGEICNGDLSSSTTPTLQSRLAVSYYPRPSSSYFKGWIFVRAVKLMTLFFRLEVIKSELLSIFTCVYYVQKSMSLNGILYNFLKSCAFWKFV